MWNGIIMIFALVGAATEPTVVGSAHHDFDTQKECQESGEEEGKRLLGVFKDKDLTTPAGDKIVITGYKLTCQQPKIGI